MKNNKKNNKRPSTTWVKAGLSFGLFMYVCMIIIYPLIKGETISLRSILIGIPVWIGLFLVFEYINQRYVFKKDDDEK